MRWALQSGRNSWIHGAVGLHALKDLLGIVEHHAGRVQNKGGVGDDARIVPALAAGIFHQEHMIGENLTEAQLGLVGGLGLEGRGFRDLDIQHFKNSPLLLV